MQVISVAFGLAMYEFWDWNLICWGCWKERGLGIPAFFFLENN
jgi:hypothetical protein